MTPAAAEPAVARDAFHSIRRGASYKPGLLRPWPGRRAPGDTAPAVRDLPRRPCATCRADDD